MSEAFARIAEAIADTSRAVNNWGVWAGSIIIATILTVWAILCLRGSAWITWDLGAALLVIGIYALLSRKPKAEEAKESETEKNARTGDEPK